MSDENEGLKPALEVTDADISRKNTEASASDSVSGYTQDQINLRNLQGELDVYEAKDAVYAEKGQSMPRKEQVKLESLRTSLNYQKALLEQHGPDRRATIHMQSEYEQDMASLEAARDSNMRAAVNRVMQKEGISKFEALQMINMEMQIDGDAAEQKYLPQFQSIKQRTLAKYASLAETPRTQTKPAHVQSGPTEIQLAARNEMSGLIAQNKADLANGYPPNTENYARIEELKQYI